MRLVRQPSRFVNVPMVLVVDVPVLMIHSLMRMLMLVCFGQMQVDACRHEQSRNDQARRDRLLEH
jgi:hypothetical protein